MSNDTEGLISRAEAGRNATPMVGDVCVHCRHSIVENIRERFWYHADTGDIRCVVQPLTTEGDKCSVCDKPLAGTVTDAIFGAHRKCLDSERQDFRLAQATWNAICNETTSGGDRPSADIIVDAFRLVRALAQRPTTEGRERAREIVRRWEGGNPIDSVDAENLVDMIASALSSTPNTDDARAANAAALEICDYLCADQADSERVAEIIIKHAPTAVGPQSLDGVVCMVINAVTKAYPIATDAKPEVERILRGMLELQRLDLQRPTTEGRVEVDIDDLLRQLANVETNGPCDCEEPLCGHWKAEAGIILTAALQPTVGVAECVEKVWERAQVVSAMLATSERRAVKSFAMHLISELERLQPQGSEEKQSGG